ncbi:LOW QUALITY PROTEIN: hypothetical protein PanWU01x14_076700, partial [Parasponia andersonii]
DKLTKVTVTAAERNPNKNRPLGTWRTTLDFDNSSRFRFGHKKPGSSTHPFRVHNRCEPVPLH